MENHTANVLFRLSTNRDDQRLSWLISKFLRDSVSKNEHEEELTIFPAPGVTKDSLIENFEQDVDSKRCIERIQVGESHVQPEHVTPGVLDRDLWMPDNLCKVCYECESPFSIFRRKHHCRFCGQVFCHSCSSYFVDGTSLFVGGTVRACIICQKQVSKSVTSPSFAALKRPVSLIPQHHDDVDKSEWTALFPPVLAICRSSQRNTKTHGRRDCAFAGDVSSNCMSNLNLMAMIGENVNGGREFATGMKPETAKQYVSSCDTTSLKDGEIFSSDGEIFSSELERKCLVQPRYRWCSSKKRMPRSGKLTDVEKLPINVIADSGILRHEVSLPLGPGASAATSLKVIFFDNLLLTVRRLIQLDASLSCLNEEKWSYILVRLACDCEQTIKDWAGKDDRMEVCRYIKVESIAGGSAWESRFVDGVIFRKQVVHKSMRKVANRPRILVIAGNIEFHRVQSKLASFETLLKQERKYTEIIVDKIVSLRPDILLVGGSVSRHAQEYLQGHGVIAIQHVKARHLQRVAKLTGATILATTDSVTSANKHGQGLLGFCHRFQMATYDTTHNASASNVPKHSEVNGKCHASYACFLCPGEAQGCAVVLRGATKPILEKLKRILRFSISVAYNHRVKQAYLRNFQNLQANSSGRTQKAFSSWGSTVLTEFLDSPSYFEPSGLFVALGPQISALSHQILLFTAVCMSGRTQMLPPEVQGILCYGQHDTSLGRFLLDFCFPSQHKHPCERKAAPEVTRLFYHNDRWVKCLVFAKSYDEFVPSGSSKLDNTGFKNDDTTCDSLLRAWRCCKCCADILSPIVPINLDTWNMSFGKFLEFLFYLSPSSLCCGSSEIETCFVLGNLAVKFESGPAKPLTMITRRCLPFNQSVYSIQLKSKYRELHKVCRSLISSFVLKLGHLKGLHEESLPQIPPDFSQHKNSMQDLRLSPISLDTAHAVCKVGLTRVDREFNVHFARISSQLVAEIEKPSESQSCSFQPSRLPSQYRHEIYLRTTNWNRRLSILGQLLRSLCECNTHMGGSRSSEGISPPGLASRMLTISMLVEELQSAQNVNFNIVHSLGASDVGLDNDLDVTSTRDRARRRRSTGFSQSLESRLTRQVGECCSSHCVDQTRSQDALALMVPALHPSFSNSFQPKRDKSGDLLENMFGEKPCQSASRDLRSLECPASSLCDPSEGGGYAVKTSLHEWNRVRPMLSENIPCASTTKRHYNISNALARFLGKDCTEEEPWTVDLSELTEGYLHLDSGTHLESMPVHEEQPTTVIAFSLNTPYHKRCLHGHHSRIEENKRAEEGYESAKQTGAMAFVSDDSANSSALMRLSLLSHVDVGLIRARMRQQAWARLLKSGWMQETQCTNRRVLQNSHHAIFDFNSVVGSSDNSTVLAESRETVVSVDTAAFRLHGSDTLSNITSFRRISSPSIKYSTSIAGGDASDNHVSEGYSATLEDRILSGVKTHIKHRFADVDEMGTTLCKFVCHAYWAAQFAAIRQSYFGEGPDGERGFLRSLSMAHPWNAQGGKSGATFLKTSDGRFVVKQITRTELQMFLEYAPAYFEYLSKTFFHNYPTILVRVLGVYQIGSHNRISGKRIMDQVVVMQNLFHERSMTRVFDLKGSSRSRYARANSIEPSLTKHRWGAERDLASSCNMSTFETVLLDENFVEFTTGCPLPLCERSKLYVDCAVLNDTLFLSVINVVDYSILVGLNENTSQFVIGIIDYMRQYDIIKRVERMGKSVGMIAGQAEPTVIQPQSYRDRFRTAMSRYFMIIPDKWSSFRLHNFDNFSQDKARIAIAE